VVRASCEPHPCAMKPRMNGAPLMSLIREIRLWVGHPPVVRAAVSGGFVRPANTPLIAITRDERGTHDVAGPIGWRSGHPPGG
jgi:hypothetical protein